MNNFEKIKQMTIDEMVIFLIEEYDGDFTCGHCKYSTCYACEATDDCERFKECLKQWLEQEEE